VRIESYWVLRSEMCYLDDIQNLGSYRSFISFAKIEKRYTTEKTHIVEERYNSVELQPDRNHLVRSHSMLHQYAVVEREVKCFLEDNFVMDKQF